MAVLTKEKVKIPRNLRKDQIILNDIIGNEALKFGMPIYDEWGEDSYALAAKLFTSHSYVRTANLKYIIESIPTVATALEQRSNKVINVPTALIQHDTSPVGQRIYDTVYAVLFNQRDNFNLIELIKHALTAEPYGFSVAEMNWDFQDLQTQDNTGVNAFVPYQVNFWESSHFQFDSNSDLVWMDKSGGDMLHGDPLTQDKYLIHAHQSTKENPYGSSILGIRCIWLAWFRATLIERYLQYCGRLGVPPILMTVPGNTWQDETALPILNSRLDAYYTTNKLVAPEGTALSIAEASGSSANVIMEGINYCDNQIALTILGQSNTTNSEKGGSRARDEVSYKITDDITKASCLELEATLNRQFIRRIISYNFPDNSYNYPELKFNIEEAKDLDKVIMVYKSAQEIGLDLSKRQVYDTFGLQEPTDEEDILTKAATPQMNGLGGLGGIFGPSENENEDKKGTDFETEAGEAIEEEEKEEEGDYGDLALDGVIMFSEKQAEKDNQMVEDWVNKQLKKSVKEFGSISKQIEQQVRQSDTPDQFMNDFKLKPESYQAFDKSLLDMLIWLYLWGSWSQRKMQQPAFKQFFGESGKLDLNGLLIKNDDILMFAENPSIVQPYEQALNYFRSLTPTLVDQLTRADSSLMRKFQAKSFWMTRETTDNAVKKTYEALQKAYQQGISPNQWITENKELFDALGFNTANPYYLNNVFRTNASLSYSSGQYQQKTDPAVSEFIDIWVYKTVGDDRTRANHVAMDGVARPIDDPFWDTNYPPNGYQCRCYVLAYTTSQAERMGLDVKKSIPEAGKADPGWQTNQAKDWLNQET